jgi:hypothetical protein
MILFYKPKDAYGCFCNFSPHTVTIYARTWKNSEAAFQATKFMPHRPDLVEAVWACETPRKAADMGRDRSLPLRIDWEDEPGRGGGYSLEMKDRVPKGLLHLPGDRLVRSQLPEALFARTKDVFMYEVCYAKFSQHADIKQILLDTGDEVLVEDSNIDPYWGWGKDHVGENKLGRILMAVRWALQRGIPCPAVFG